MRIHSDKLTQQDFTEAAKLAGVLLVNISIHGSQSRKQALEFTLSGNGINGGQWGTQDYKTATWDEWGIVLGYLFEVDPLAHTGKRGYLSAEHFHWVTGDRYRTLRPNEQHLRHNWLSGDIHGSSAGGAYWVQSCKCGAFLRQMAGGHEFAELAL